MSNPKLHHFIPKSLQGRFADPDGVLHAFDKRFPQKGVWASTPTTLFAETHLYSTYQGGTKDAALERQVFSPLDGEANQVLEKIVISARANRLPNLSASEKRFLNLYIYFQWKRTPDRLNTVELLSDLKSALPGFISEYESRHGRIDEEEIKRISAPQKLRELSHSAAAIAAASHPTGEIESILDNKGLCIGIAGKSTKSFIIGSNPVVRFCHPVRTHLAEPDTELWLPIAADVVIAPIGRKGTETTIELYPHQIRKINTTIFHQSTTIAGRSKPLIESLAQQR